MENNQTRLDELEEALVLLVAMAAGTSDESADARFTEILTVIRARLIKRKESNL